MKAGSFAQYTRGPRIRNASFGGLDAIAALTSLSDSEFVTCPCFKGPADCPAHFLGL